ncbi:MAG: Uma2 family endonuclease [Cyanobium sp.]
MTLASSAPAETAARACFSVEQFHRVCEAVPERRLELIGGEVLDVIAKGTRHSVLVNRLNRLLTLWLEQQTACLWELRVESPLRLGELDEPEPDLALVRQHADGYLDAHPTAADTILVIEVAGSSLRFDLETKARLYDAAGIGWYWVIDAASPRLIPVAQGLHHGPLLEALRTEVEALLTTIPPATPG